MNREELEACLEGRNVNLVYNEISRQLTLRSPDSKINHDKDCVNGVIKGVIRLHGMLEKHVGLSAEENFSQLKVRNPGEYDSSVGYILRAINKLECKI